MNDYRIVLAQLVDALDDCLAFCDQATGANLPEMISQALTEIAVRETSWRLVEHRPGSWEATHIVALDMSNLYPL